MEDPSTWPGRNNYEPLLSDEPLTGEPIEGLRLPFEDLQQLHNEMIAPPEQLDVPIGEPVPFDAAANTTALVSEMAVGYLGLAVDGALMAYNWIAEQAQNEEVKNEYRQSLINAFLKRSVYVFVRTPGDSSGQFKWWEGIVKNMDVTLEEPFRINWFFVEYMVNAGNKFQVHITDASNIMINKGFTPRFARPYMYAYDAQVTSNAIVTFDIFDNYVDRPQMFGVGDIVSSMLFEDPKEVQEVIENDGQYTYILSGIDNPVPQENLIRSSQQEMNETLARRDAENAQMLAISTPQPRPGWGIVFLNEEPFVLAHNDEVHTITGYNRFIFRDSNKTLYIQLQTNFKSNITRIGDLPFPMFSKRL